MFDSEIKTAQRKIKKSECPMKCMPSQTALNTGAADSTFEIVSRGILISMVLHINLDWCIPNGYVHLHVGNGTYLIPILIQLWISDSTSVFLMCSMRIFWRFLTGISANSQDVVTSALPHIASVETSLLVGPPMSSTGPLPWLVANKLCTICLSTCVMLSRQ